MVLRVTREKRNNTGAVAKHVVLIAHVKHATRSQTIKICLGVAVVRKGWLCGVPIAIPPVSCSWYFVQNAKAIERHVGVARLVGVERKRANCRKIVESVV